MSEREREKGGGGERERERERVSEREREREGGGEVGGAEIDLKHLQTAKTSAEQCCN